MGGGLELGVFPEQSTNNRSSPAPLEARRWGWGSWVAAQGALCTPACSHLPDSCSRVPAGNGAAVLQPSRFFYSS